jgi:hypothetical protein
MYRCTTNKEGFISTVDTVASGSKVFLLRQSHAETNDPSIEKNLTPLLLLWGLTTQGESTTTQIAIEAEPWSGKEIESSVYLIPVSVVLDALLAVNNLGQLSQVKGNSEQESLLIQQHVFELLAYIFGVTAQQLSNDLASIKTLKHVIKQLEKLPAGEKNQAKLIIKYEELASVMITSTKNLQAMAELHQAAEVSSWLNMRVESDALREAKGRALELYFVFLQSIHEGTKLMVPETV